MPLGDSNTLNVKEILKIYLIEKRICLGHRDEWCVCHSCLPSGVSDCTVNCPPKLKACTN